jgi:hypothetical protein
MSDHWLVCITTVGWTPADAQATLDSARRAKEVRESLAAEQAQAVENARVRYGGRSLNEGPELFRESSWRYYWGGPVYQQWDDTRWPPTHWKPHSTRAKMPETKKAVATL